MEGQTTEWNYTYGSKVVCICGGWQYTDGERVRGPTPELGKIYTVERVDISGNYKYLYLIEFKEIDPTVQHRPSWDIKGFKPVNPKKTSIEVFTSMLNKKPVEARRRESLRI